MFADFWGCWERFLKHVNRKMLAWFFRCLLFNVHLFKLPMTYRCWSWFLARVLQDKRVRYLFGAPTRTYNQIRPEVRWKFRSDISEVCQRRRKFLSDISEVFQRRQKFRAVVSEMCQRQRKFRSNISEVCQEFFGKNRIFCFFFLQNFQIFAKYSRKSLVS